MAGASGGRGRAGFHDIERGCCDQGITVRAWIGYMQASTATGDLEIDGQDAVFETRQYLLFQPAAQQPALYRITAFLLQDAGFEFEHRDRGKELSG